MPARDLTPQEAAEVLRIVRSTAGPAGGLRANAIQTLAALAENTEAASLPYVALVTVTGGCAEVICGDVALVDFDNLQDPDDSHGPVAIETLATRIATELGDEGDAVARQLRDVAQSRRIKDLRRHGTTQTCTVRQLEQAMQAAGLEPDDVIVTQATVKRRHR